MTGESVWEQERRESIERAMTMQSMRAWEVARPARTVARRVTGVSLAAMIGAVGHEHGWFTADGALECDSTSVYAETVPWRMWACASVLVALHSRVSLTKMPRIFAKSMGYTLTDKVVRDYRAVHSAYRQIGAAATVLAPFVASRLCKVAYPDMPMDTYAQVRLTLQAAVAAAAFPLSPVALPIALLSGFVYSIPSFDLSSNPMLFPQPRVDPLVPSSPLSPSTVSLHYDEETGQLIAIEESDEKPVS